MWGLAERQPLAFVGIFVAVMLTAILLMRSLPLRTAIMIILAELVSCTLHYRAVRSGSEVAIQLTMSQVIVLTIVVFYLTVGATSPKQ
jgi:hypothetical protein